MPVALSFPNPCIPLNLTCPRLTHALHVALLILDLPQRVRDYLEDSTNHCKMQNNNLEDSTNYCKMQNNWGDTCG